MEQFRQKRLELALSRIAERRKRRRFFNFIERIQSLVWGLEDVTESVNYASRSLLAFYDAWEGTKREPD